MSISTGSTLYSAFVPAFFSVSKSTIVSEISSESFKSVAWIAGDSLVRGVFFAGATAALLSLLEKSKGSDFKTPDGLMPPGFLEALENPTFRSQMSLKTRCFYVAAVVCGVAAVVFLVTGVCTGGVGLLGGIFVITKDSMLAKGFSPESARSAAVALAVAPLQVSMLIYAVLIMRRRRAHP